MIAVTTFKGRKVALFGLGGSGLATAQALVAGGAEVTAWDDNPDSVAKAGDRRRADRRTCTASTGAPSPPSCSRPACR